MSTQSGVDNSWVRLPSPLIKGERTVASKGYYERIDAIFEVLEDRLDTLPQDLDVVGAEGVINVTFPSGVVFVFSRQPPTEQLWLATPGGGFHYQWSDPDDDWLDTKSGNAFKPFVVAQLAEHAGVEFTWSDD